MGPTIRAILRGPAGAILIALQIALTLAIVSNSMYLIKTRIDKIDRATGVQENELIFARIFYYGKDTDKKAQTDIDLEFFRQLPGVKNVTTANSMPLAGSNRTSTVCYKASDPSDENCPSGVSIYHGRQTFIDTLGLELIAGRRFAEEDFKGTADLSGVDSSVLIVTQEVADRYFPNGDALGKIVYMADKPQTIVGIVKKLQRPRWGVGGDEAGYSVIAPIKASPGYLVIRADAGSIASIKANLEQDIIKLNDSRVVIGVRTMADLRDATYRNDSAIISMLIIVIALLVSITALGISGLVSFSVANRRKQIGTRRALGARRIDIIQQFLLENALVCGLGVVIGAGLAFALGGYLMQNFSLPSLNPWFVAGTIVLLLVIAQLAAFFPALRAANISPAIATRTV